MRLVLWLAAGAIGCTLPPNVITPNCNISVTGIEQPQGGWVYCSTSAEDANLSSFTVRDATGDAIVLTAPGAGSFACGKPNLEIKLQYNGTLQLAGCNPVTSCGQTSGSCTVEISKFTVGDKPAFAGAVTAFAASAPGSSAGYNFKLSGSFGP